MGDAAKKEGDEWENEVYVSTTTEEFDKDSEGSYTTIAEVVENQKVIEENVEDNQEAIDDDQDVVIEDAQVIVKNAFLIKAEQPIVGDDQNIIEENVRQRRKRLEKNQRMSKRKK